MPSNDMEWGEESEKRRRRRNLSAMKVQLARFVIVDKRNIFLFCFLAKVLVLLINFGRKNGEQVISIELAKLSKID